MTHLVVGAIAGYLSWKGLSAWAPLGAESIKGIAGMYAQIAVTMLGFMLAMLAILVSVADRRAIRNIARTGHFEKLLRRLYYASGCFGATLVASVVTMMLLATPQQVSAAISNGFMMSSIYLLVSTGRYLWKVLMLLVPESGSRLE